MTPEGRQIDAQPALSWAASRRPAITGSPGGLPIENGRPRLLSCFSDYASCTNYASRRCASPHYATPACSAERRTPSSRRAAAHRRGVPGQRKARHLRQSVPVEPQNIDVAVDKVCDVEPAPIRAGGDALGESADIGLSHLADRLSVDLDRATTD